MKSCKTGQAEHLSGSDRAAGRLCHRYVFLPPIFRSIPEVLVEAARIDGAGPVKFFIDILVPLSSTMIAAMFIIMFVFGWNQYLWPTMITTKESIFTLVRGIKQISQGLDGTTLPEYGRPYAGTDRYPAARPHRCPLPKLVRQRFDGFG
ncbi:MAG: hypothetical protein ACJASV_000790 [Pseudorhodobacter sp.]|jgi:hypothetical protein